jgi:hypothetical protein
MGIQLIANKKRDGKNILSNRSSKFSRKGKETYHSFTEKRNEEQRLIPVGSLKGIRNGSAG